MPRRSEEEQRVSPIPASRSGRPRKTRRDGRLSTRCSREARDLPEHHPGSAHYGQADCHGGDRRQRAEIEEVQPPEIEAETEAIAERSAGGGSGFAGPLASHDIAR